MLVAANRQTPTGGVQRPRTRFITTMTPNWMESTPTEVASCKSTGKRIRMAAMVSMNMPTKIRKMFMSRRRTYLLSVRLNMVSAIILGMCSLVMMYANTLANATRAMMDAALERVCCRHW